MVRQYHYQVKETMYNEEKRWNLYVQANRRFSLKEMLAKQHWVIAHIDELPFNNITLKIASCRESNTIIQPILPDPLTSAFHVDIVTLDKINRIIQFEYDFVLEFVFSEKGYIEPFLAFLQEHWCGEWQKDIPSVNNK